MRIAILSDIHGNSIALDCVLQDIAEVGGVDRYWVLGDLVAMGPDPVGVLQRLERLPNAALVRGNTDRVLAEIEQLAQETLPGEQQEYQRSTRFLVNMAWTQGAIAGAGYYPLIASLPLDVRLTLPDGTRVLGVHAAPGDDDGPGFHPGHSDAEMQQRLAQAGADLVFVGHTHWPMNRRIQDVHLVNLGPVNLQPPPDNRAKYVILEADADGYTIEHRYVDYDHEAVVAQLERLQHPAAAYLSRLTRGGMMMPWMQERSDLASLIPEPFVKISK